MVVADKTSDLASVMVLHDYTVVGIYASDPVGAIYSWRIFCPDGSVGTIRMNTLQKPYDFTMDGYVVAFRNYTATTVDVTVTAPDGTTETKAAVALDATSVAKSLPAGAPDIPALMTAPSGLYKVVAAGIFDPDSWFKNEVEGEARDMCVKAADAVVQTFSLGLISFTKIIAIADKLKEIKVNVIARLHNLAGKIDAGGTSVVHGSEGPFNIDATTDTSNLGQLAEADRKWGKAYRERLDGSTSGNVFANTTTRDAYMNNTYTDYSDWSNYSDWGNAYSNWSNAYSDWSNAYSDWSNVTSCCKGGFAVSV